MDLGWQAGWLAGWLAAAAAAAAAAASGPGATSKSYGGCGLIESGCCLFERIQEVVKHKPRLPILMEKLQLRISVGQ